ncbi:MAG: DUF5723 family protein [Bacteroidota bacterium]
MKRHFLLLLGLSCCMWTQLIGQSQLSLHFMPVIPQAQESQPAYMPPRTFTWAMPNLTVGLRNSDFAYRDLVQPVAGTDSFQLNVDQVLGQIDGRNDIRLTGQAELLQAGFRIKGLFLGLGVRTRWEAGLGIPKDLLTLAWEGNTPAVNQKLELAPMIQARAWQEISARGAIRLLDKIQVGARLAYLTGLADLSTGPGSSLEFRTLSEYYQLEARADYTMRTSVLDFGEITNLANLEPQFDFRAFTGNSGLAADLGILFDLNKRWRFSASVVDLGFLRWKDNAQQYHINGQVDFAGLDGVALLEDTDFLTDSLQVEALIDSVLGDVQIDQTPYSYSTFLPARTYLSARYQLLGMLHLGALWQTQSYYGKSYHALALHGSVQLKRWLGFGLTYNMQQHRYDQLGVALQLTGGPVMFFVASDNALAFISPDKARHTNLRFGLNLVIGKQDL